MELVEAEERNECVVVEVEAVEETRGEEVDERPVRDAGTERPLAGELLVRVERVEVAGQTCADLDGGLGHRAAAGQPLPADLPLLPVEADQLPSPAHDAGSPRPRAMRLRWISEVPPPMVASFESR